MTRVIGVSGLLVLLSLGSAVAQDKPPVLEETVVTATKTETPVAQTGASVTVIKRQEIEQRQATDVIQVLREQPGFSLIQTGGRGGTTSIFTRGGNADMNLVLIDGMKVNQGGGNFDFANTTTIGIGRAEIIRGPQSSLYGADAMTSVIQFFTPRGQGPLGAWGFAGGGNYGTHEERTGVSWGDKRAGAFFEFGNVESQGILKVNNDYRNTTGALRLDLSPMPDLDFTLTARVVESLFQFPTNNAGDKFDVLDPHQFQENERFVGTFGTRYHQAPWLEHRLKVGVNHEERNNVDRKDAGGVSGDDLLAPEGRRTRAIEERRLVDYSTALSSQPVVGVTPVFVVGAAYEHQRFEQRSKPPSTPPITDVGRETTSAYGQMQLGWVDRIFLNAGLRYDDSSVFGREITPRVALAAVAPVTETRARGAWGTGIKEPSFSAQFGGATFPGNPSIKSEKSESFEVGFDQPLLEKEFEVSGTYFENHFEDLVAFVSLTQGFKNIQGAKTQGAEIILTARPTPVWMLSGTYTHLHTEVTDDGGLLSQNAFVRGKPLLRRPTHSGTLSVGYTYDRWSFVAALFLKGDSLDRDFSKTDSPRVTLKGYGKVDVSAAYTVFKDVSGLRDLMWKTRVQNLFNEDYQEVFGFSSPGLTFLTGVEVRY